MDSTYSQIIPEYEINKESEGSNGQEMIPIGSDFEADVLLIQIHDHKMEKDRIIKLFEKETSHIKTWKDQEITKLDKKIQWLSQHLEVFLVSSESERLNLPHGKVSYRKQPFHVEVLDENKLISGGFVRTKVSVDKQSIMNHFKATGEIPEGCEIERPDKKLVVNTIQTNKGG